MCENLTVVQWQVHVNLDCNLQLTAAKANMTMFLRPQNQFLGPILHLLIVEIASVVQRDRQEDNVT